MIPYYQPPSLPLGPVTLEVFGLFVVLGVFVGARLAYRAASRLGLDPEPLADFGLWGVIAGVVGGHFVHLFLYHPEELTQKGWTQIFKFWDGLSSFGGLLGAVIAAFVFFRRRRLSFARYADALALGTAAGWAVARLGCFAVHDHPGVRTDFFLAVRFPGGARHDLGLYDALALGAMAGLLFLLHHRRILTGRLLPLLAVMYAPARFFFDTLRATDLSYVDARYLGLTPAQYFCMVLAVYGVWGLTRKPPAPAPAS